MDQLRTIEFDQQLKDATKLRALDGVSSRKGIADFSVSSSTAAAAPSEERCVWDATSERPKACGTQLSYIKGVVNSCEVRSSRTLQSYRRQHREVSP
eukprot:8598639-Pyramimonas_sp.AAC.2